MHGLAREYRLGLTDKCLAERFHVEKRGKVVLSWLSYILRKHRGIVHQGSSSNCLASIMWLEDDLKNSPGWVKELHFSATNFAIVQILKHLTQLPT